MRHGVRWGTWIRASKIQTGLETVREAVLVTSELVLLLLEFVLLLLILTPRLLVTSGGEVCSSGGEDFLTQQCRGQECARGLETGVSHESDYTLMHLMNLMNLILLS